MMKEKNGEWITMDEALEITGLTHPNSIYYWVRQGVVRKKKTPRGKVRFNREDVLKIQE